MKEDTGISQSENPSNPALSTPARSNSIALTQPQQMSGSKAPKKGGDIVASAQRRTSIAKRESMAQAVQDGQEANRVYAQTFLTVLDAGTNEFSDSLTEHLGGMRESLLEVEDDEDFLAQLMANGCGGALPSQS